MNRTWRHLALVTALASGVSLAQAADAPRSQPMPTTQTAQTAAVTPQAPGDIATVLDAVRDAYADISEARSLLGSKSKSGGAQSLLAKAEHLLSEAKSALPSGAILGKLDQAESALGKDDDGAGSNGTASGILGGLQASAAQVDPSVAAKLGEAQTHAQNGRSAQASNSISQARQKLKTSPLESAFDKVVAARSLLEGGAASQAKKALADVPSLSSLERTVTSELSSAIGMGGAGSAGGR